MVFSLRSVAAAIAQRLRSPRQRMLASLVVIGLLRYVYHRQRRHVVQQRVHLQLQRVLSDGHPEDHAIDHRAVEEWHDIDGEAFGSIVYKPKDASTASNKLVLFIPGNPGLPHFYLPLMRDIVRRFGTHHEVRSLSHAGHYMPWKNNGKIYDLQHQYELKIAYLRERLAENPSLELVLVSHSIGAYLMLKIMEAFPDHIAKAVFMQPTFHHIGKSTKGTTMMPLFEHRHHSVKVIDFVEFLTPLWLRRWIASHAVGAVKESAFVDVSVALVNRNVIHNVLHMAHQEMIHVGDVDADTLHKHEDKTLIVYSPIDGWVPNEYVQMFQLQFPKAKHRVIPQGHGFMVEPNGSRDMADHIAQWVADVLKTDESVVETSQT